MESMEKSNLMAVAEGQKRIIILLLVYLLVYFLSLMILLPIIISSSRPPVYFLVGNTIIYIVFALVFIFLTYKLASALDQSPILVAVLMFVPLVNIIVVMLLSNKATKRLKNAGIKVGLLGVNMKKMQLN